MSEPNQSRRINPFDQLGIDPTLSPAQLTERLQRMAQRVGPQKRAEIRAIWRELTLKDSERVALAFFAHPRGPETGAEPLDTLRQHMPSPTQESPLPALQAHICDALLEFVAAPDSPGRSLAAQIRADAGFSAIKREGSASSSGDQTS